MSSAQSPVSESAAVSTALKSPLLVDAKRDRTLVKMTAHVLEEVAKLVAMFNGNDDFVPFRKQYEDIVANGHVTEPCDLYAVRFASHDEYLFGVLYDMLLMQYIQVRNGPITAVEELQRSLESRLAHPRLSARCDCVCGCSKHCMKDKQRNAGELSNEEDIDSDNDKEDDFGDSVRKQVHNGDPNFYTTYTEEEKDIIKSLRLD
jgi:hypothetical protein